MSLIFQVIRCIVSSVISVLIREGLYVIWKFKYLIFIIFFKYIKEGLKKINKNGWRGVFEIV